MRTYQIVKYKKFAYILLFLNSQNLASQKLTGYMELQTADA